MGQRTQAKSCTNLLRGGLVSLQLLMQSLIIHHGPDVIQMQLLINDHPLWCST